MRPKGWNGLYDKWEKLTDYSSGETCSRVDFEAGADAYEGGLKKGAYIPGDIVRNMQSTSVNWYDSVTCRKKGNWYFISEDE